jgi:phage terminase large subunit-like protein
MIQADAAMRSGRLMHHGTCALAWCIGNVVCRPARRGNLYPTKQRPEQKIDAAVALTMVVGRAMTVEDAPSIYESGGIFDCLGNAQRHLDAQGGEGASTPQQAESTSRAVTADDVRQTYR